MTTKLKSRVTTHNQNTSSMFLGYMRSDQKVGTRNYYVIIPLSLCAADTATQLAQQMECALDREKYTNIDGVVSLAHTEGCGCGDNMIDRLLLTLKNIIHHPNVGGVLVIGLGCEKITLDQARNYFGEVKKPIDYLSVQQLGGTGKVLAKGKALIERRLKQVNQVSRESVSLQHLIVGTECGASDGMSSQTANPLIGCVVDKVIAAGGAVLLSETPEMLGAETELIARMHSQAVIDKFNQGIQYYRDLANRLNVPMSDNLVACNKQGGLSNSALKSRGAILKGGSSEIVDFLDYAEFIKRPGLSLMNGPGNDLESMTGMAASGANLILFSTGAGTTEGHAIVPVIKIASRSEVYQHMKEDIDFDAGRLLTEKVSLPSLCQALLKMVCEIASGQQACAEHWQKRSFQIWTAGKLSL